MNCATEASSIVPFDDSECPTYPAKGPGWSHCHATVVVRGSLRPFGGVVTLPDLISQVFDLLTQGGDLGRQRGYGSLDRRRNVVGLA